MTALLVFHERERVGSITADGNGRMRFVYDEQWLHHPGAFRLSNSLPLAGGAYEEVAHRFFANLLPEGSFRESVCRRLGISVDNDYALLARVGEDCAGALTIVPEDRTQRAAGRYVPIDDTQLAQWNEQHVALGTVVARGDARLSLAGAQDKLPVFVDAAGKVCLPTDGAPSSHLLKFSSERFFGLAENEVLTTRMAAALGLNTVHATLHVVGSARMGLLERYDRYRSNDGVLRRLHQEDLCQALGLSQHTKYEAEGGPSFARCVELIRELSHEPLVDVEQLLRWQIFNALAGNCDGHAKNLSLLHSLRGVRLAPFYDLVCTRAYNDISIHLAMAVGGQRDAGALTHKHWTAMANAIGVRPKFVLEHVEEMADALANAQEQTLAQFEEQLGQPSSIGRQLQKTWRKLARRVLQGLGRTESAP